MRLPFVASTDTQSTRLYRNDASSGEWKLDITKCPCCFNVYEDPRFLPCFHTVCFHCVDHSKKAVTCPLCYKKFSSAEVAREQLPQNVFVRKLLEISSEAAQGDKSESLHRLMSRLEPGCQSHNAECFQFYCFSCDTVLCSSCFDEEHQTHRCTDLGSVESEFRLAMALYTENLNKHIDICRQSTNKLEAVEDRLVSDIRRAEKDILEQAHRMTKLIDQDERKLLLEIDSSEKSRIDKMDEEMRKQSRHVALIDMLKKYTEELKAKGTAIDVAREVDGLQKATDRMLKVDTGRHLNGLRSVSLTFTAADVLTPSPRVMGSAIGHVDVKWTRKGK
jgi:hypothetical protein